jgi:hypothetical protein
MLQKLPRRLTCNYQTLSEDKVLEVIYPQVPLRIPCYDLALLTHLQFELGKNRGLIENAFG